MAAPKKQSKATPQPVEVAVHAVAEGEYPSLYSNFMGVGATPFDISIMFAEVVQRTGKAEAVPRIKVMMAPEQAANLVVMLRQVLLQFVAQNGTLRPGGRMEFPDES